MYPNRTYRFAPPEGLWKVMARVTVFVTSLVVINTLIGFKSVSKVIQVLSFVAKCWPKGHKGSVCKYLENPILHHISQDYK